MNKKRKRKEKNDKLLRKLSMEWMCAHKNSIVQHKKL